MYVAEFTLLVSHGNVVHCFFHRRMGEAQGWQASQHSQVRQDSARMKLD
jgi:hypothetical protein